jgi:hypothetical protein
MRTAGYVASLFGLVAFAAGVAGSAGGCSSSSGGGPINYNPNASGGTGDDSSTGYGSSGGVGSSGGISLGNNDAGPIQVADTCPGGGQTTISGRVYDPANVNPVYNATVFVPQNGVPAFMNGAACGCTTLYPSSVLAVAVTDANGNFTLKGTSSGKVPLVVQVGKWRMQYTINVTACQANPQNDHSLRLPQNHTEGDIPQIAISTGGADSLECLPLRMGVDASEFVAGPGTANGGHIHVYTGYDGAAIQGGIAYDPAQTLWDQDSDIDNYDVVLFSCEGQPTTNMNTAGQQVILDYANNGGRVFASHYHYAILTPGPFSSQGSPAIPLATWQTTNGMVFADADPIYGKPITTLTNGMPFPEGVALQSWLGNVGALSSNNELEIHYARDNAKIVTADSVSQSWMNADMLSLDPGFSMYFSFDTPITGGDHCGRVVYSDLHVSGGYNQSTDPNSDYPGFAMSGIVPGGCSMHALTPQEKALEFMIFDLSSCLIPIGMSMPVDIPQ